MYKWVKKVAVAGLISASVIALVACSSGGKKSTSDEVKVGILQYMEHDSLTAARKGFVAELEKEGYKEGKNLTLDYQNAQGDQANLQTISEQLVRH